MSRVIGLTGGIACGKSQVSTLFAELGVPVIDTDKIAHALTQSGGLAIAEIRQAFGQDSLDAEGALDRTRMRERIFSDPHAKSRLEDILHPLIFQNVMQRIAASATSPYLILAVPLLFETRTYLPLVDRVLVVDCNESQQIERARARSQLDETMTRRIMAQQVSRKQRLAQADDIINNHTDLQALSLQVLALHERYLSESLPQRRADGTDKCAQ